MCVSLSLLNLQSGKGSKKEEPTVKIVYLPHGYIPVAGGSNIQFVSEDEEISEYVQTPAPSKRPSDAVKIVYVPITVPGDSTRSGSGDDEQEAIATIKTPVPTKMPTKVTTKMPTKMPTKTPSAKPSVPPSAAPSVSSSTTPSATPSLSPTSAPSATPTTERWCNMEYERGCRDSCFKERGCGTNDTCKKKCRKQCCSWN